MRYTALVFAAALVAWPLGGHAQDADPAAQDPDPASPAGAAAQPPEPQAPDKPKKQAEVEVRGRVFVRDTISRPASTAANQSPTWSNQMSLDSARLGARYRNRKRGVQVEVEAELAGGKAELRDGYVRLQPRPWIRVQAGRFKEPISAVNLTSRWDLPVIERGLLGDFELANELTGEPDRLPLGGRNIGVQAELRSKHMTGEPRLIVAVFRGRVHDQIEESQGVNRIPLGLSDGFADDLYARLELETAPNTRVGVSLGWIGMLDTAGTRDTFRHGFVGGIDLVVDSEPVRLWLEGFLGDSPVHFGTNLLADGQFAALRAIVAVPLRTATVLRYIEPYAMAQYMEASSVVDDDRAYQVAGGVNFSFSKSWRVQTTADHIVMDNRLVGAGTRFILQLGAVF